MHGSIHFFALCTGHHQTNFKCIGSGKTHLRTLIALLHKELDEEEKKLFRSAVEFVLKATILRRSLAVQPALHSHPRFPNPAAMTYPALLCISTDQRTNTYDQLQGLLITTS